METVFLHPFQILKANPEERSGAIKILVKASTEEEDKQGEIILKSAYQDPVMRKEFLNEGYFDYNHLTDIIDKEISLLKSQNQMIASRLVELQKSKVIAIIGGAEQIGYKDDFPTYLQIKDEGLYILGNLFPENTFVEEIRKGLQAGFHGWGASVSGYARPIDKQGNKIRKIKLKKCAIAPLQEVYNPNTSVQLLKGAVFLKDLEKETSPKIEELENQLQKPNEEIEERILKMERKLQFFTKIIELDPNIQERFLKTIFSDISSRFKNKEKNFGSIVLKSILSKEYLLEGEELETLSDLLFLKLNGEKYA
ncbi:hypothetical protein LEP1GSC186_3250 [Leptospira noguchii serovar Autumnalis str. ZUN142]|uniref:Uncharacterized protein n=1 Tax=Leptospira noguchii serovar Autumnalis str. ZUN142 TaxID=1085540 RepID=M6U3E6_9LEPT|nr:hypothetical protein [Leptospira noguchii]EMO39542.1 hypothetical protein LEP1GSC186_3250 [Leptospira noguchii serovar Autumnalis str. ZUN142]